MKLTHRARACLAAVTAVGLTTTLVAAASAAADPLPPYTFLMTLPASVGDGGGCISANTFVAPHDPSNPVNDPNRLVNDFCYGQKPEPWRHYTYDPSSQQITNLGRQRCVSEALDHKLVLAVCDSSNKAQKWIAEEVTSDAFAISHPGDEDQKIWKYAPQPMQLGPTQITYADYEGPAADLASLIIFRPVGRPG